MNALNSVLLSVALSLGACTADRQLDRLPQREQVLENRVEAQNVLVTQGVNGDLTIDAEINGDAITYRVHRERSGEVTEEQLDFQMGDAFITYDADPRFIGEPQPDEALAITQPGLDVSISRNFRGEWVGYPRAVDGFEPPQELSAGEVRELLGCYLALAQENFDLVREALDIDSRIANTIIQSDYDEITYALTWMPTPNEFELVVIDECRDMLQVTTDRGFTYLYGTPRMQITDRQGEIIFVSHHGFDSSGDFVGILGRNTEINELHGEQDYNHGVYSEGEARELLDRARQLHREFFQNYAPREHVGTSRHFLSDYTRFMPGD